jgi:hypothetical protein
MYARITKYKMKPGTKDAAIKIIEGLKDQVLALEGQQSFLNVMNADGHGYVISTTVNAETAPETGAKIAQLWGAFSDVMEDVQPPESFEVITNW